MRERDWSHWQIDHHLLCWGLCPAPRCCITVQKWWGRKQEEQVWVHHQQATQLNGTEYVLVVLSMKKNVSLFLCFILFLCYPQLLPNLVTLLADKRCIFTPSRSQRNSFSDMQVMHRDIKTGVSESCPVFERSWKEGCLHSEQEPWRSGFQNHLQFHSSAEEGDFKHFPVFFY